MKQKQEELKRLKEILSEKKRIRDTNKREKDHLFLEHCECLRKEAIHSLDIKNIEHQIEMLEEEIEEMTMYPMTGFGLRSALTKIYRVVPSVGARLFIEFSDDFGECKKNGVLYYNDMDDEFRSRVAIDEFDEAFIDRSLDCLMWRTRDIAILGNIYMQRNIPQLLALMRF